MIDLNLMRSFVAVDETGGISRAAGLLGLPKSTLSRHLARLEADLGEPLVRRGVDGVVLLEHGRRLFERVRGPVHALGGLTPVAGLAQAQGHVRLVAARFLGRHVIAPLLVECAATAPDVDIDYRAVDRSAAPDPAQFDLAVTVGPVESPDCDQLPLRPVEAGLYAARGYTPRTGISALRPPRRLRPMCRPGRCWQSAACAAG